MSGNKNLKLLSTASSVVKWILHFRVKRFDLLSAFSPFDLQQWQNFPLMMMLSTQINRSFDQTTQSETLELISRSRFFHSDSHSQPDVHRLTDFSEERNREAVNSLRSAFSGRQQKGFKVIIMILLMLLMFWLRQKPPIGMRRISHAYNDSPSSRNSHKSFCPQTELLLCL